MVRDTFLVRRFTFHETTSGKLSQALYILALLHSNGTDVQAVGLPVGVAEVEDIHATATAGDEDIAGLGDLALDRLLLNDLDQGGRGHALVPGVDFAAPKLVPAA